ncbi:MAG: hypothetical protein JWO60_976 [Frankiales bacterium]|nr:hypothetical protein [Frankiales bacterium]
MGTFTDDDLLHLLGEAADSYPVPDGAAERAVAALEDDVVVPLVRRRSVQLASAAAVAVVGLVLGVGLFGGDDVDRVGQLAGAPAPTSLTYGKGAPAAAAPQADEKLARSYDPRSGTLDTRDGGALADTLAPAQALPGRAAAGTAAGSAGSAPGAAAGAPAAAAPVDGARVVKKGSIALVVDDRQVTPTLTRVQGFAKAAGGTVAGGKTEETGSTPSGSVTLRVPVDAFEQVVAQVRGLPGKVRASTTSGQDVTAQYADVEAQIATLKAARSRFLTILERANSIGDVLSVQQRVDDVTGRIDRLEGQRRVLADQSDTATLEVSVTEADDAVAQAAEPDTGLSKAFRDAGTGFTTGVEALVRLSGRGLLVLLLLGLTLAVLRVGWRLSRRRLL